MSDKWKAEREMEQVDNMKITINKLNKILEKHKHWLNRDCYKWETMRADLSYADLSNTNLSNVDLHGANLKYVNLCEANLSSADLRGAGLYGANLRNTGLSNVSLYESKGPLIEYRKGKFITDTLIGYKKCRNDVIVTLEIPRGAIVFSINGTKCRTNKAKVISIDGADRGISRYKYMSYYVGDEFTIYDFNYDYSDDCGSGIHFFMSRKEAEEY